MAGRVYGREYFIAILRKMQVFLITSEVTSSRKRSYERVLESLSPLVARDAVHTLDDAVISVIDADFVSNKVCIVKEEVPEAYRRFVGAMHIRQLHNAVKHVEAIRRIAALPDSTGPCLVLEDDVIVGNDHIELLRKRLAKAAGADCMILLGVPAASEEYQSVAAVYNVAPTCDSYLIKPAAARRLLPEMLPIRFATTVQLTYAAERAGLPLIVGRPNVMVNGSLYGVFGSTITVNNNLILNPTYMRALDVLSAGDRAAPHDLSEVDRLLRENPLKQQPDFLHMSALLCLRRLGAADPLTKQAFEAALNGYDAAGCILNHESAFLNTYMQLFKELQ